MAGTERHATHCSVDAGALVFASRVEVLSILIHASIVFAGTAIDLCPADAMGAPHIVAVVTLKALVVVAGLPFMTILVELRCTHFTTTTAVRDQADPGGTGRGSCWTFADHWTASHHPAEGRHL